MAEGMVDLYGIPEFFINCVTTESAGNGNVRVINFARRGGLLIPQFSAVIASVDLLIASRCAELAAEAAFVTEQWGGLTLAH